MTVFGGDYSGPALKAVAVTPNDDTNLGVVRALYIGTEGDVAVIAVNDTAAVTFVGVKPGILAVSVWKVMATNTDAGNIVALY